MKKQQSNESKIKPLKYESLVNFKGGYLAPFPTRNALCMIYLLKAHR